MVLDAALEVQQMRNLLLRGDLEKASRLANQVIEASENTGQTTEGDRVSRWENIADAEECLAVVAFLSDDDREAVNHCQQAILRSGRFRGAAYILAAFAQA